MWQTALSCAIVVVVVVAAIDDGRGSGWLEISDASSAEVVEAVAWVVVALL